MPERTITCLLDTSEDLEVCAEELGLPVGQLLTPLTRFRNRGGRFAIDNGAFAGLDVAAFRSLLQREEPNRDQCIFVTVPDVVCSMRRTLELFHRWRGKLAGWPLALAIQNGVDDFDLPWEEIDAVFIGGDDSFKQSLSSEAVIATAKALGKWVHVGRVNDPNRFAWCVKRGVDSIDGSGMSQYSHQRRALMGKLLQQEIPLEAVHAAYDAAHRKATTPSPLQLVNQAVQQAHQMLNPEEKRP